MKSKILIFICGVIVGCVITVVAFFVFGKVTNKMPNGRMPMNENGEFVFPENMEDFPEMPEGGFKGDMPRNDNTIKEQS